MRALFIIPFLLFGCAALPLVETFYVGSGTLQYYLRASRLAAGAIYADTDFTCRKSAAKLADDILCNFTLVTPGVSLNTVRAGAFDIGGRRIALSRFEVFYTERSTSSIRVSSHLSAAGFADILTATNVSLHLTTDRGEFQLAATEAFYRSLKAARIELVEEQ